MKRMKRILIASLIESRLESLTKNLENLTKNLESRVDNLENLMKNLENRIKNLMKMTRLIEINRYTSMKID